MARPKRICPAGEVFHVLNRSVARLTIFEKPEDYMAFLRALDETWERVQLPIFAMVLMPNHWHFVVRPSAADQVQSDHHLLHVIRYVEPNPLRANLAKQTEAWQEFRLGAISDGFHCASLVVRAHRSTSPAPVASLG